jgi:hypothetical protein
MLDPRGRTLLFEALRPPDGYALDMAVGTTYSLDLMALLAAPLAFTFFDSEDREGRPMSDPLVLLEALRSHARRITIFCQAGRIVVPPTHRPLLGYLEGSVVEAAAPNSEGAFHPKVWALRFTAEDQPVRYRVLCLSRNLTFDRSWDTALVLDGELRNRKNAIHANHPIGNFFQALPGMAVRGVTEEVQERVDRIQHEIRRVRFELPDGFEEVHFWPFGLGGRNRWPFSKRYRPLLVVAPFVSDSLLKRLADGAKDTRILVSRVEELDRVSPETIGLFTNVYAMAPEADPEDMQESANAIEETDEKLSGLHAKLYLMDDGWHARVWTGSANATAAAFERNVELLVELRGRKAQCGVKSFLDGAEGRASFIDLLQPYTSPEEPPDEKEKRLEKLVNDARRALARARLRLVATRADEPDSWNLAVRMRGRAKVKLPAGCAVRCWPVSLTEERAAVFDPDDRPPAILEGVSWQSLTSFVAFSVEARQDDEKAHVRFVLNLPLEGGPPDRQDRLLEQVLTDRAAVLRFLLLLLADDVHELTNLAADQPGSVGLLHGHLDLAMGMPLFESLVRALDRDPERLDRVARLVDDLSSSETGHSLLPDGFDELWQPIWKARQELRDG